MAKQLVNQRKIYKINSSRFRLNKWDLTLKENNTHPQEIVSIGDNQVLEFIRIINCTTLESEENKINKIKKDLKFARNKSDKTKVKHLYKQLNESIFIKDLCFVVIDKKDDYRKLNKKMKLNGVNFKRLLATTGGVETSTIIYASERVHEELCKRIENDRNMNMIFSAGKLEAYKSLSFSNSIKVTNPRKIVIVDDYVTKFNADIIELDDSKSDEPTFELKKDFEIELIDSDGYGIMTPQYADIIQNDLQLDYLPSGVLLRNAFLKGMCFPIDFVKYAKEIAENEEIIDVYGENHNINDIDMILPTSVFKLWDSYESIDDYIDKCNKNGFSFRIAKVAPKELENERNLNYQFIQPLDLSDEDIENLCSSTVSYIKDIVNNDPYKSILFTKGVNLTDENLKYGKSDFTKALMIEPKMINDPFVKNKIHDMARRKIKDAKIGVLKCPSNFQIVSGDIYGFMEHIFNIPQEDRLGGLLKSGEVFSNYWNELSVEDITIFRAPMSSHNNIRKMKTVDNELTREWFKYIKTCMIINSWDTVSHALNGMDKDADSVFSTNLESIQSNVKELPAVICKQKSAPKKICEFEDFVTANINGFGDEIGSITNKITSMFCVQSNFDKYSKEYKELEYRIICGQLYQQNAIDKIKSIQAKPMPSGWYSPNVHVSKGENGEYIRNEFQLSILAEKKPYFFIHNYKNLQKEYSKYISDVNTKSLNMFGKTYTELCSSDNIEEYMDFINKCELLNPVNCSSSTMNRLCWHVENQLNDIKFSNQSEFDYTILKSDVEYNKTDFNKIKKVYEQYRKSVEDFVLKRKATHSEDINDEDQRQIFIEKFKEDCYKALTDEKQLCNIVLDICYSTNKSKQFAWDICGERILLNLLEKNDFSVNYPIRDNNGEILFNGEKFTIKTMKVGADFATNS